MTTKIFVTQIDATQADGTPAAQGSIVILGSQGGYWGDGGAALSGYQGSAGYFGSTGYQGSVGYMGSEGEGGPAGFTGSVGYQGSVGYFGSAGAVGYQGSAGDGPGYQGSVGETGYRGSVGEPGPAGTTGFTGSVGDIGPLGYQGSAGDQGPVGYQGSAGEPGNVSANNFYFIELLDAPSPNTYTGNAGKFVKVKTDETGLEFVANTYLTNTVFVDVNFNNNKLINPLLASYGETVYDAGLSGAATTIQPEDGNVIKLELNSDVVAVTLGTTNLFAGQAHSVSIWVRQDGTGNRTIDWTLNTIYWPETESPATGPVLSTDPGKTDIITLYTLDAGVTWFGMLAAKGFAT